MMRHLILIAPLLWACPSAGPKPDAEVATRGQSASGPLPGQLIDASAFVEGRVVGDEVGWHFEQEGRKSERVPWPTRMGEARCVKDLKGRLAWSIEGSERFLVLHDEPLIVERRPDCLAAVPVRRRPAELGKKTVEVVGDDPRVALWEADAARGTLAVIAATGDPPSLELEGVVLDPVGAGHEDEDQLGCLSAFEREKMLADDPELEVAPARHEVSATWYGVDRAEVLELTISQSCEGDPSLQGGAVAYERETRWVLEREGPGWRQVELEVGSQQSSSGDGAGMRLERHQDVHTIAIGGVALVGRRVELGSMDSSHYGSSTSGQARTDWWLVPVSLLAGGIDELAFEDKGLRLTPPSAEPERAADLERTSGTWPIGGCSLALLDDGAALTCGDARLSAKLTDTLGEVSRRVRVWDLGAALFLRIELGSEHCFTEPVSEDDPSPVDFTSTESQAVDVLVSKRGAAKIEVGRSSRASSM